MCRAALVAVPAHAAALHTAQHPTLSYPTSILHREQQAHTPCQRSYKVPPCACQGQLSALHDPKTPAPSTLPWQAGQVAGSCGSRDIKSHINSRKAGAVFIRSPQGTWLHPLYTALRSLAQPLVPLVTLVRYPLWRPSRWQ